MGKLHPLVSGDGVRMDMQIGMHVLKVPRGEERLSLASKVYLLKGCLVFRYPGATYRTYSSLPGA